MVKVVSILYADDLVPWLCDGCRESMCNCYTLSDHSMICEKCAECYEVGDDFWLWEPREILSTTYNIIYAVEHYIDYQYAIGMVKSGLIDNDSLVLIKL